MKMLLAGLGLLILIAVSTSCGKGRRVPDDILEPKQMQDVMWDLMRSGEFLNGYVLYKDSVTNRTSESLKWYDKVWELHHLTEAQFRKSYDYYRANPLLMQEVLDSISKLPPPQVTVKTPAIKAESYADSLARAHGQSVGGIHEVGSVRARNYKDSLLRQRGLPGFRNNPQPGATQPRIPGRSPDSLRRRPVKTM